MRPIPKTTPALSTVRPIDEGFTHFIFDFDGTITTKDTINVIAQIGIMKHDSDGSFETKWTKIVQKYQDELDHYAEQYSPKPSERTTLEEEIKFQRSLQGIELRSFNRISTSGLLAGISKAEWEIAGCTAVALSLVEIREGFKELVKEIEMRNGVWGSSQLTSRRTLSEAF